ncbi:hypothetical protein HanXRQr2_Chr06g0245361 [Helianthus annuus]|uniref:Uncharacterized protein n=1 Tax=Helianthus annuus TaxID=4232 RepID=A0A9K3IQP2_HELAN|nr:hypothetical protein HanXRQr2_Chr06g0245361 [Helianthus annuus]KAJ0572505.1 hypothetical protein HanHA89_Chr06g0216411 [Helianthus annuus]KAJ0736944.1 hypothetical protein HanLR1_Chr06g0201421 [Helianthus annuus]
MVWCIKEENGMQWCIIRNTPCYARCLGGLGYFDGEPLSMEEA